MKTLTTKLLTTVGLGTALLLGGCEMPPPESSQWGYRGTGMEGLYDPDRLQDVADKNVVPDAIPAVPAVGPKASDIYKNVQVLGDLSVGEFTRLMVAVTQWVSPEEGCNYCHVAGEGFEADTLYTKKVARVIIQMTPNENWDQHVGGAGVTCYTCHRGKNVPEYVWNINPGHKVASGMKNQMQNVSSVAAGLSSLPVDPFTPYLLDDRNGRHAGTTALRDGGGVSMKESEWGYSLMMHFSDSLGVNCTYCHNSRAFFSWDESAPTRVRAWHGIRMVREMNNEYVEPTTDWLPPHRLGVLGDAQKVNCETCHQGAYKPLLGANMIKDYPNLARLAAAEPEATLDESMDMDMPESQGDVSADMTTGGDQ
jgi:photosynthetic reaction center cytochrome c subunit